MHSDARTEPDGDLVAALLLYDSRWIARRKETVTLLDDRTLRRRISVDCSLPARAGVAHIPENCLAPVMVIRKAPAEFTDFDFEDESSASLPLPTSSENADVSALALVAVARTAIQKAGLDVQVFDDHLKADVVMVALDDPLPAAQRRATLLDAKQEPRRHRAALLRDPHFPWISSVLSSNSIVAVELQRGERRILKLSYDEHQLDMARDTRPGLRGLIRRFGWEGYPLWLDLPFVGASSYHFEARAPRGIEISDSGVVLTGDGAVVEKTGLTLSERVHVYFRQAHRYRHGIGWVTFRVYRGGFITWAIIATASVLVAFLGAIAFADDIVARPTGVAPLLLLFPGVIAAAITRPGRHALALRLLSAARWLTFGVAFLAYYAAARVALMPPGKEAPQPSEVRTLFGELAIFAFVALVMLFATRLLPRVRSAAEGEGG